MRAKCNQLHLLPERARCFEGWCWLFLWTILCTQIYHGPKISGHVVLEQQSHLLDWTACASPKQSPGRKASALIHCSLNETEIQMWNHRTTQTMPHSSMGIGFHWWIFALSESCRAFSTSCSHFEPSCSRIELIFSSRPIFWIHHSSLLWDQPEHKHP